LSRPLSDKESDQLWDKIISESENLPVLPDIINKVLQEIDSETSNPDSFQKIISQDPVLTAKVLKMSNSAYYGFSREISTISEAVLILGMDTLKSLAIAASAVKLLNRDVVGYGLGEGGLWKHSLAAAMSATLIAKQMNIKDAEKYFVAGLLHDIGKILLSGNFPRFMSKWPNIIIPFLKPVWKMHPSSKLSMLPTVLLIALKWGLV
jgi:HD-like signal output (HDOD) protein